MSIVQEGMQVIDTRSASTFTIKYIKPKGVGLGASWKDCVLFVEWKHLRDFYLDNTEDFSSYFQHSFAYRNTEWAAPYKLYGPDYFWTELDNKI